MPAEKRKVPATAENTIELSPTTEQQNVNEVPAAAENTIKLSPTTEQQNINDVSATAEQQNVNELSEEQFRQFFEGEITGVRWENMM